jgi:hypothetical protein
MNIMFKDLALANNTHAVPVNINGNTISVLQYLPITDKHELIETTINNTVINGVCDYVKLHALYRLYIVCLYTDIDLDEEDMENSFGVYDILESNGVIDEVMAHMDPNELALIDSMLHDALESTIGYQKSFAGTLTTFSKDLPTMVQQLQDFSKNLDLSQFQQVIDIANATGANA